MHHTFKNYFKFVHFNNENLKSKYIFRREIGYAAMEDMPKYICIFFIKYYPLQY